jgi:DMSO/TMAO reductase YedYZ molybdopterin-dependent catalytic subunit
MIDAGGENQRRSSDMGILSDLGMPVFKAGGMQDIDPAACRLKVSGLAAEMEFSLDEIKAWPMTTADARLTSVSGFSVRALWQGAVWREFMQHVELQPGASHATFVSAGGGYQTTVSLADLDHPRVLLCYSVGDLPLEPTYGGPLRMFIPHLWGYKSAKWLAGIEFTDRMHGGYWEDRGYPREAAIQPGTTLDINTGQRRNISGFEVTEF